LNLNLSVTRTWTLTCSDVLFKFKMEFYFEDIPGESDRLLDLLRDAYDTAEEEHLLYNERPFHDLEIFAQITHMNRILTRFALAGKCHWYQIPCVTRPPHVVKKMPYPVFENFLAHDHEPYDPFQDNSRHPLG